MNSPWPIRAAAASAALAMGSHLPAPTRRPIAKSLAALAPNSQQPMVQPLARQRPAAAPNPPTPPIGESEADLYAAALVFSYPHAHRRCVSQNGAGVGVPKLTAAHSSGASQTPFGGSVKHPHAQVFIASQRADGVGVSSSQRPNSHALATCTAAAAFNHPTPKIRSLARNGSAWGSSHPEVHSVIDGQHWRGLGVSVPSTRPPKVQQP